MIFTSINPREPTQFIVHSQEVGRHCHRLLLGLAKAHERTLASVYADGRDSWAYLDLSGVWPQGKGEALPSLAALAGWVKAQVAAELEA